MAGRSFVIRRTRGRTRRAATAAAVMLALLLVAPAGAQMADHVVISEWSTRGPGGSTDEFLELYNPTDAAVDVSGWAVETFWASSIHCPLWCTRVTLPGATGSGTVVIPPRHYLLIADSCGSYTGTDPDYWFECTIGFRDNEGVIRINASPTPDYSSPVVVDQVAWCIPLTDEPDRCELPKWADNAALPEGGVWLTGRGYENDFKSMARKASSSADAASMAEGGAEHYAGNGWDSDVNIDDILHKDRHEPQGLEFMEPPVRNSRTGEYSATLQAAVDAALSGDTLTVNDASGSRYLGHSPYYETFGVVFPQVLTLDGKDLTILDSGLQVSGDVSLVSGATLVLEVPAAGP